MPWRSAAVGAAVVVGLDLLTKALVRDAGHVLHFGILDVRPTENSGVAFGVGAGLPAGVVLAVVLAAAVLVGWFVWRGAVHPVPLALLGGGVIANLVDRALGGSVTDFVHVGPWPAFNLADVGIVVGVATSVLMMRETRSSRS